MASSFSLFQFPRKCVGGVLSRAVYAISKQFHSVAELKFIIIEVWDNIDSPVLQEVNGFAYHVFQIICKQANVLAFNFSGPYFNGTLSPSFSIHSFFLSQMGQRVSYSL